MGKLPNRPLVKPQTNAREVEAILQTRRIRDKKHKYLFFFQFRKWGKPGTDDEEEVIWLYLIFVNFATPPRPVKENEKNA